MRHYVTPILGELLSLISLTCPSPMPFSHNWDQLTSPPTTLGSLGSLGSFGVRTPFWTPQNFIKRGKSSPVCAEYNAFFFFLIVCFTSYFVFSIAVLPHSPGVVYYHLLLRRETRIPGVAPFSFRIGFWDLFVHRGQKSYTPTAFGKLWTTPGVRCMKHASS